MSTEAMRKALEAMDALIERGSATKVALDADIPNGEPVHPLSAALTWPLAVAKGAANDLRTALAAPEPKAEAGLTELVIAWADETHPDNIRKLGAQKFVAAARAIERHRGIPAAKARAEGDR